MNLGERLTWFKSVFGARIEDATIDSPISLDLVSAIALQETGYLWGALLRHHDNDVDKVLEGCVGDTLDYPSRRAFPRNREALEGYPDGEAMFEIGRAALAGLAEINGTYRRVYERDADRFCRGYGILQYDLQHMQTDPTFFLEKQWLDFDVCLEKCLTELRRALRVRGFAGRDSLTVFEAATVAIVYNRGRYDPARELRQGHRDRSGKYYGEYVFDYIKLSQSITPHHDLLGETVPDDVILNYSVNARGGLRLRGGPGTDFEVLDTLELGHGVNVLRFMGVENDWALVDLQGDGKLDGFMYAEFLTPIETDGPNGDEIEDTIRLEMSTEDNHHLRAHANDPDHSECTEC